MSVTGHIIGNWNLTGEVNETGEGANVVPNPPEEATETLEKIGIDDVVYSITGEQEQADWDQADPTAVDYIKNKPTIPAAQVNSDWDAESGVAEILNKPTLSAVATSGSYTDLTDTPTIPAAQVNSDWDAASGVAEILNKPSLSTVATSGSYTDLIDKPTIPAAQVNSDWNAASGVAQILNKPTIPAAQVNSDWDAASGVAQILNKPTLAAVATSGEAEDVSYDNSVSGMTATDVQAAVDELKSNLTDYVKYEIKNTDRLSTNIEIGANTQFITNYYSIRNGICEFNVSIVAKATISNASTPVINLPTPRMANTLNLGDWIDFNTNTRTGAILQGGILYTRFITNGVGYSISGRYEVDPSWSPST